MTENYKSWRIVEGKPRWVVVDENGNIINRSPSKDDLRCLKKEIAKDRRVRQDLYNETNTCDICKTNFDKITNYPLREYKNGINTGKWICNKCYMKDYNARNMRRTGNLDPNSNQAKGDNFEELTCRWRTTISVTPVENLNKKYDNYEWPIDHSPDSELGIIDTQGRLYNRIIGWWNFTKLERYYEKGIDHIISYCANEDGTLIERLYIFPIVEIKDKRTSICIIKNPSKGYQWYEEYRIKNENTLKLINGIWKEIIGGR